MTTEYDVIRRNDNLGRFSGFMRTLLAQPERDSLETLSVPPSISHVGGGLVLVSLF